MIKTAVVTGATDGIGLQTAIEMARRGFRVIVMGRDARRCEESVEKINRLKNNEVPVFRLCADFTDRKQIKEAGMFLSHYIKKVDVLINNAGTFENNYQLVEGKYEKTFFVNHLAPFYFTYMVLELMTGAPSARIINVSSMAHSSSFSLEEVNSAGYFDPYEAYSRSKLANILFTFRLSKLLKDKNIAVNCLHPGVINTKLLHAGWGPGGASVQQGAETSVFLATDAKAGEVSGHYFVNKRISRPAAVAHSKALQDELWQYSEEVFGIDWLQKLK